MKKNIILILVVIISATSIAQTTQLQITGVIKNKSTYNIDLYAPDGHLKTVKVNEDGAFSLSFTID